MGLLDVPRGLISRLPLIGGSNDSTDDSDEETSGPVAEAPEEERPDDEPDTAEQPVEDEPDEPEAEDEPEKPQEDEPDSDEPAADTSGEDDKPAADDSSEENISDTTAPSIGPNTVIEKDSAEERLARHEQSDTDAMGLDKRREVIGGNYNASFGKQVLRYVAVVVVVAAAAFGLKALVSNLDQPPAHPADKAPWSGSDQAPAPLE